MTQSQHIADLIVLWIAVAAVAPKSSAITIAAIIPHIAHTPAVYVQIFIIATATGGSATVGQWSQQACDSATAAAAAAAVLGAGPAWAGCGLN